MIQYVGMLLLVGQKTFDVDKNIRYDFHRRLLAQLDGDGLAISVLPVVGLYRLARGETKGGLMTRLPALRFVVP